MNSQVCLQDVVVSIFLFYIATCYGSVSHPMKENNVFNLTITVTVAVIHPGACLGAKTPRRPQIASTKNYIQNFSL